MASTTSAYDRYQTLKPALSPRIRYSPCVTCRRRSHRSVSLKCKANYTTTESGTFTPTAAHKSVNTRTTTADLREDLADELVKVGLQANDADRIATWDPYDQNASADWFDAEYMFGVSDGFDIVIGNPPYIQLQKNSGRTGGSLQRRRLSHICPLWRHLPIVL